MPSTGFRSSVRCSSKASNQVYVAPGNTTASISVSVVAPKNAVVFVQPAALDGVTFSTAQTYQTSPGTVNKDSVTTVLRNAARTTTTQFALYNRHNVNLSTGFGPDWQALNMGYVWQYRAGADVELDTTIDTTNSNWKTLGPALHDSSTNNRVSFDKGGYFQNTNSVNLIGLTGHPVLDIRAADPVYAQIFQYVRMDGNVNWIYSYEENSSTYSQVSNGMESWSDFSTLYPNTQIGYNSGYSGYSNNVSYGNGGGACYRDPAGTGSNVGVGYSINQGSSGYFSAVTQYLTATGNNWSPTNQTTGTNWIRNVIQNYTYVNQVTPHGCIHTQFDGTIASNESWYVVMFRYSTDGRVTLARKKTNLDYNVGNDTVEETPVGIVTPPDNTWYPVWCIQLNGYYYLAMHKYPATTVGYPGAVDQKLYRTSGSFTAGTWSEVTDYPDYVDLLPMPIVINDTQMLFAKWSDTVNNRISYENIEIDISNQSSYSTSKEVDYGALGLAMLEVGATDTWTQTFRDYSALVDFVSPNQAVTDAATDAGLTFTKMRTVTDGSTLYDLALHTSDTSFRNTLATFGDRANNSDITSALGQDFERTNFVLNAGDRVFVYTESDDTIAHVYGYEDT